MVHNPLKLHEIWPVIWFLNRDHIDVNAFYLNTLTYWQATASDDATINKVLKSGRLPARGGTHA